MQHNRILHDAQPQIAALASQVETRLTNHAMSRADQRAIDDQMIRLTVLYGTEFFKQGLTFYVMRLKDIPSWIDKPLSEKLNNLVVVCAGDSSEVITCYRSKNCTKHLKRKSDKWIGQ